MTTDKGQFMQDLIDVFNKYEQKFPLGLMIYDYQKLLSYEGYKEMFIVQKDIMTGLQHRAEQLLSTVSLGEQEKQHLVNIVDGKLPSPLIVEDDEC